MGDMRLETSYNIWYWVAAFFILMAFQYLFTTATQVARIPYNQFETYLRDGRIAEAASVALLNAARHIQDPGHPQHRRMSRRHPSVMAVDAGQDVFPPASYRSGWPKILWTNSF